jgi:hypothetical protein
MKSNEELNKKYSDFFTVIETKIETQLDLIPSVSESIVWGTPKEKKTIMSEEEFDRIFGDMEI